MKYIKSFENIDIIEEHDKISINYPFFILDYNNSSLENNYNMTMCKILNIENDFFNWEEYDYDDFEKGYQVINRALHIKDFNKYYKVVKTFKTFKEMKNGFNIILTSNKFNL